MSVAALVSTRAEYDHLFSIYVPIAAVVFAVLLLAIVIAVLRYRHNDRPTRRLGADALEGGYAVLLACVVAFLLYETFPAEHRVDTVANRERPSLTVDVIASRWEWEFRYPGYGITQVSGYVGDQPLVVPADRAIRFELTSRDVIHSLYVPQLQFKRDLIPGMAERVTLTFTRRGIFDGQCAEFCGLRHAEMTFRAQVLSPAAFTTWLAAHRAPRVSA